MAGAKFTSFVMYIVLLITFLGFINMVFSLHRFAFYGEFLILLGLLLVAVISAVGISNNFRWAWILLMLFFAFVFIDMLFIVTISRKQWFFLYLTVVVILGFFVSLFSIKPKIKEAVEERKGARTVTKTFKPGKYIASKTGTKFHAPKCDWAKKVKKSNAIWFDNKEDALKAGYKKDDCVR